MTINGNSILKKTIFVFLMVFGLYYGKDFLMPITIAAILSTLFLPLCRKLEQIHIPRLIAVILCFLILLSIISGIIGLLGWQISELNKDIILIKEKAINSFNVAQAFVLKHFGIDNKDQIILLQKEQPSITNVMSSLAGTLSEFLSFSILVSAYFILLLFYRRHIHAFILQLSSTQHQNEVKTVIADAAKVSQQYLLGLAKMIVCLWIMYAIGFSILGIKNALFFAFLCGLLEIVPYIGNITGTLLTLSMAIVQGASYPIIFGIIITYGTVQFIQGWILEPIILGPQVKINPLFTILSLIIGQLIWGVAGMFLAIPILAILKIIFDHFDVLKPIGFLIGDLQKVPKNTKLPIEPL